MGSRGGRKMSLRALLFFYLNRELCEWITLQNE